MPLNRWNNKLEACLRDDFCCNNTELMRWRKSVCDLAGRSDCRRPELWKQTDCFFCVCIEGRESRVGRYLGLMPGVDVKRQNKNQRKFSGERLRLAAWIWTSPPPPREKAELDQSRGQTDWSIGSTLSLKVSLEFNVSTFVCSIRSNR